MKPRLGIKVKIILICLGLLFSLIFLEIFFEVSAFINRALFLPKYDLVNVDKKKLVIFCFGDSFTYGIGAGFSQSYPAQLERILNKTNNGRQVKVFNFGVPGYNSSQILQIFKKEIAKLKPDIVILLCGANDSWNLNAVSFKYNLKSIKLCITRLKMYKFLNIFVKNIKNTIFQKDNLVNNQRYFRILANEDDFFRLIYYGNIFRSFNCHRQARLFYDKAIKLRHNESIGFIELGRCYKMNDEYLQAIDILGQALVDWPDNNDVQAELEDVFIKSGLSDEAIKFYEFFLNKFPTNKFATSALSGKYIKVGGEYFLNNRIQTAIAFYKKAALLDLQQSSEIFKAIQMMEKVYEQRKGYESSDFKLSLGSWGKVIGSNYFIQSPLGQQLIRYSVSDNLSEMIEFCKKNNIKIILSGYPAHNEDSEKYEIIRNAALTYGVSIVDHRDAFCEALKHKPLEYYYISRHDQHCTKEGYRIMAENIARQISEYLKNKL